MTAMQIELLDATAPTARDAGLAVADRVAAAGMALVSRDEINAEVKAARAERTQRAGGPLAVLAVAGR